MKKYSYYFIPFLLIFFGCAIQNLPPAGPSSGIMKQANKILIETPDSPAQSFDNMKNVLRDQGYSFQTTDDQQFKLYTNYKKYGKSKIKLYADVVNTDSSAVVEITGMISVPQFNYRQEYGGSKPSTTNRIKKKIGHNPAWDIMQAIADKYPEGMIWYAREKS